MCLDIVEPSHIESVPSVSPQHEVFWLSPITRLPSGLQNGLPSTLDYLLRSGCKAEGTISWHDAIADHAVLTYDIDVRVAAVSKRPRTHWKCSDLAGCLERAKDVTISEKIASHQLCS